MYEKLKWLVWDFDDLEYGIHSKIPLCCIEFFIYDLHNLSSKKRKEHLKDIDFGYIPCPKCKKTNNKVKLHYCKIKNKRCQIYRGFAKRFKQRGVYKLIKGKYE